MIDEVNLPPSASRPSLAILLRKICRRRLFLPAALQHGGSLKPPKFEQFRRQTGQRYTKASVRAKPRCLQLRLGPIKLADRQTVPLYRPSTMTYPVEDGVVGSIVVKIPTNPPTGLPPLPQRFGGDGETWPGSVYNTGDLAWRTATDISGLKAQRRRHKMFRLPYRSV